jgi:pyruvate,orthophosphate dikinase
VDGESAEQRVAGVRAAIAAAGVAVPSDPVEQLRGAVEAVFRSWDSARAKAYRQHEGISEDLGTAVNVQAMVFGNYGADSGTGVVFTRDPSTGHLGAYGDFLPRAQGEDVVSGTARTLNIAAMAQHLPAADEQLRGHLARLEQHYRDMCDVEFTVERGTLWILQTRVAKRGAVAAVRTAVAFAADPGFGVDHAEALERAPEELRERARAEVLAAAGAGADGTGAVATGLAASPGRVSGAAVFSADEAADADSDVILVRPETSPEDVHGMSVSVGVLTSHGGLVSHAAVVARGWGIPAVVGAERLQVGADAATDESGEVLFRAGDVITIDGGTGQVWLGEHTGETGTSTDSAQDVLDRELPELAQLTAWAGENDRIVTPG